MYSNCMFQIENISVTIPLDSTLDITSDYGGSGSGNSSGSLASDPDHSSASDLNDTILPNRCETNVGSNVGIISIDQGMMYDIKVTLFD